MSESLEQILVRLEGAPETFEFTIPNDAIGTVPLVALFNVLSANTTIKVLTIRSEHNLHGASLSDEHMVSLTRMLLQTRVPKLQQLHLFSGFELTSDDNAAHEAFYAALRAATALTHLSLQDRQCIAVVHHGIDTINVFRPNALKNHPGIHTLYLAVTMVGDNGYSDLFDMLTTLPVLSSLTLYGIFEAYYNVVHRPGLVNFIRETASSSRKLRTLAIVDGKNMYHHIPAIAEVISESCLEHLEMVMCELNARCVGLLVRHLTPIDPANRNRTLKVLVLDLNDIGDTHATIDIATLIDRTPALQRLSLNGCGLTSANGGVRIANALRENKTILSLTMNDNEYMNDDTGIAIARALSGGAGLAANNVLQEIGLRGCKQITDATLIAFNETMRVNRTLRSVDLSNNPKIMSNYTALIGILSHQLEEHAALRQFRLTGTGLARAVDSGTERMLIGRCAGPTGFMVVHPFQRSYAGAGVGAGYMHAGYMHRYNIPHIRTLIRTRTLVQAGRARPAGAPNIREIIAWLCCRAPLWVVVHVCELMRPEDFFTRVTHKRT